MQYPVNSTCCGPYDQNGFCYTGCGQTMPIVPGSNPALNYWNGQNFIVSDGSVINPIKLPNLQQTTKDNIQFVIGVTADGTLALVPASSFA
jgi:hypothetical protein